MAVLTMIIRTKFKIPNRLVLPATGCPGRFKEVHHQDKKFVAVGVVVDAIRVAVGVGSDSTGMSGVGVLPLKAYPHCGQNCVSACSAWPQLGQNFCGSFMRGLLNEC